VGLFKKIYHLATPVRKLEKQCFGGKKMYWIETVNFFRLPNWKVWKVNVQPTDHKLASKLYVSMFLI
jgi:hypothetical protein